MKAIEASKLAKYYRRFLAVDHVSFDVDEGEVFGFLGPNGAGKTTTIKMLNTLTRISEGTARVYGFDVSSQAREVRKTIGVVPQEMTLDREMTGLENIRIQARLYGIPSEVAMRRADQLLTLVDMKKVAGREVNTYSWGMQKRLELIMGLVHDPKVIFLDEPTLGLDAQTRATIWEYVRRLNKDFMVTIFLTTHYLEEADELCGRIGIIDGGKLRALGTPSELKNSVRGELVKLRLRQAPAQTATDALAAISGVKQVKVEGTSLEVEVDDGASAAPKIVLALAAAGAEPESVVVDKTDLNQVFLRHISSDPETSSDEDVMKLVARERLLKERR